MSSWKIAGLLATGSLVLWLLLLLQLQGCADDKCPDGTSTKALGYCHVPDGAGGKSAAGTGSMKFELWAAGSKVVDVGGHGGGKDENDNQASDRDGGNGVDNDRGAGGSAGSPRVMGMEVRPESDHGGQGGGLARDGGAGGDVLGAAGSAGSGSAEHLQPACGNGQRDPGELCDGDCPVDCDDNNACTDDVMHGSPDKCDVFCGHTTIEAGSACGNNAYCSKGGECLHNCKPGQPKCAGQPGTGSCVEASSFVVCDGDQQVCVATYIPAGSTCGPGLTCDADHNCKSSE